MNWIRTLRPILGIVLAVALVGTIASLSGRGAGDEEWPKQS